ncbi:hypothetical protein DL93DRAFT_2087418, partial [Clavulina sp. PMI_390]
LAHAPVDGVIAAAAGSVSALFSAKGVIQYTIQELCEEIKGAPDLASTPIADLYRREIPSGVLHEFIMLRSVELPGRPSVWLRIDRTARGYPSLSTRTLADDTARLAANENHHLMAGKSRLRAHVEFKYPLKRPHFFTVSDLLSIIHQESTDYRLFSENCYFFTSIIQEILTEFHGGEIVSGSLGHKTLGASARRRVRRRFVEQLHHAKNPRSKTSSGDKSQKTSPLAEPPLNAPTEKSAGPGVKRVMPNFRMFRPR